MTSLTDTQVVTASGGLVELGYQSTNRTNLFISATSQASAVELVSTTVVCDGSPILVELDMGVAVNAGEYIAVNVFVDGTATYGFQGSLNAAGRQSYTPTARITPAAGSRTISIRWYRWGGTTLNSYIEGTVTVRVSKIVQATQWPAVTTGTIICTSSTRPASPFEGQVIYETDTDKQLVWNGAAWKQMAGSSATLSDDLTVSGNLFRPNNPMFSASGTVGSPGTWNTYASVTANVGSHFNTTTGIFTTPTAGYYYFIATGFKEYSASPPTQYYLGVNGVGYKRSYTDAPVNRYAATPGTNAIFYLNVGDTVSVIQTNGTMHNGSNMHFSGWMIG